MVRWRCMSKRDAEAGDEVDVLLISTYDTDGAGHFTHLLARTLQELRYSIRVVCVRKQSLDAVTYGVIDHSLLARSVYRLRQKFDQQLFRPRAEYAFIHIHGLADSAVLAANVWPERCKLIICTFLSGMMSHAALLKLRSRYGSPRVVFYGVDMNFYTAGCHYARECGGYRNDCSACPAVPGFARGLVRKAFLQRQACYRVLGDYVVVASSHEHHEQICSSTLFGGADVRRILMFVDHVLFGSFEASRLELRDQYELSGFRVVLLRSSFEPRKGCALFIEAVRWLAENEPATLEKLMIVSIGDQYVAEYLKDCKVRLWSPGYIADEAELARLYATADVFVNTSLADGGPAMLAQALMSGTPVITTDVGLARDLVVPPSNGYILSLPSRVNLVRALVRFSRLDEGSLRAMRVQARELAIERLGKERYTQELGGLIEEVIGER